MQAQSVLESAEASQVKIQATALQKLYDFRSRNPYGSWNIVSSSTDASYFNFDSYSGEITSVGALDFTTKQNYNFDPVSDPVVPDISINLFIQNCDVFL